LWNMLTGKSVLRLEGHQGAVSAVAFSPDGKVLSTGSADGTVKLWRVDKRGSAPPRSSTLQGHGAAVQSVAFSPKGDLLATGSSDCSAMIWDVMEGSCLLLMRPWAPTPGVHSSFQGHRFGVCSVAFSPDGTVLVTGSADSMVKLWSTRDGQCMQTLTGHSLATKVHGVACSPEGSLMVSGSEDGSIKVWSTSSCSCEGTLKLESRPAVHAVTFLPGPWLQSERHAGAGA